MTEPVTPTPISPLPPAPLITDTPEVFDDKAFPFAASLDTLRSQVNVAAGQTNQNAVAAKEGAAASASSATSSQGYADASSGSAAASQSSASAAAISANAAASSESSAASDADWISRMDLGPHSTFPTADNQGRPIIVGAHFLYTGVTPNAQYAWDGYQWIIGVNVTAGVTQINGEAGALILKTVGGISLLGVGNIEPSTLYRSPRTSNVQLAASDKGKLIDITSGTFTQTFAAVATLGDGWWCYLRNSGTGDITLDPNESEQIDGLTSYVMYPGECRLVQCDGAALRSIVLNAFSKTFTASGTFTKPPGYSNYAGLLWGGGGRGHPGANGPGGGGGACAPVLETFSRLTATTTVTVGAGDTASVGGGTSVFGLWRAYGGGPGASNDGGGGGGLQSAGGTPAGGAPSAGNASILNQGFGGGSGGNSGANFGGASSIYGGGGGGFTSGGQSVYGGGGGSGGGSAAGASIYGGTGGASGSATGTAGTAPGGGGGGGTTPGAGARGELRIWGLI